MTFQNLNTGDRFDFVDDARPGFNSFFLRCTKTGARTYESEDGMKHRVGSIKAEVFHILRKE